MPKKTKMLIFDTGGTGRRYTVVYPEMREDETTFLSEKRLPRSWSIECDGESEFVAARKVDPGLFKGKTSPRGKKIALKDLPPVAQELAATYAGAFRETLERKVKNLATYHSRAKKNPKQRNKEFFELEMCEIAKGVARRFPGAKQDVKYRNRVHLSDGRTLDLSRTGGMYAINAREVLTISKPDAKGKTVFTTKSVEVSSVDDVVHQVEHEPVLIENRDRWDKHVREGRNRPGRDYVVRYAVCDKAGKRGPEVDLALYAGGQSAAINKARWEIEKLHGKDVKVFFKGAKTSWATKPNPIKKKKTATKKKKGAAKKKKGAAKKTKTATKKRKR